MRLTGFESHASAVLERDLLVSFASRPAEIRLLTAGERKILGSLQFEQRRHD